MKVLLTRVLLERPVNRILKVIFNVLFRNTSPLWVPRWCSGNVNITDWMYGLFGVLSSIPVNVKTVQMLFNVVWSFLFTVWMTIMRLCAELITRHIKIPNPSETRGSFFEKAISPWRILVPLHYFYLFLFRSNPLEPGSPGPSFSSLIYKRWVSTGLIPKITSLKKIPWKYLFFTF